MVAKKMEMIRVQRGILAYRHPSNDEVGGKLQRSSVPTHFLNTLEE